MHKLLTTLLGWLIPLALLAQFPLQQTYTAQDGMAMTESAVVKTDGAGYLWILSTNGRLSRFDGQRFKTYPPEEEGGVSFDHLFHLLNGDVLAFKVGSNGSSKYTILQGDSLLKVQGLPEGAAHFNTVEQDAIYFRAKDSIYRASSPEYAVDSVFAILYPPGLTIYQGFFTSSGQLLVQGFDNATKDRLLFPNGTTDVSKAFRRHFKNPISLQIGNRFIAKNEDPRFFSIYNEALQLMQTVDLSDKLGPKGQFVRVSKNQGKYYLTTFDFLDERLSQRIIRVYHFAPEQPDQLVLFTEYLPASTNGIKWDLSADGTLWATDHAGLHRVYPNTLALPSYEQNMVNSLHAIGQATNGTIYLGGYGSGFSRLKDEALIRMENTPFSSTTSVMPASFLDTNGELLFLSEGPSPLRGLIRFPAEGEPSYDRISSPENPDRALTGYHFSTARLSTTAPIFDDADYPDQTDSVDQLVISLIGSPIVPSGPSKGQFALVDLPIKAVPTFRIINGLKGIETRNVLCTAQDRRGRIWFGHQSTGIGIYDPQQDTATTWLVERDGVFGAINMVIDKNDRLWFGGRSGLYYIDSASHVPLNRSLHLRSRQKRCLIRDIPNQYVGALLLHQDTLIVGHGGGVSMFNINASLPAPPVVTFPTAHFMGVTEQNALLLDAEGQLWVGADDGAIRLDRQYFRRERRMQGKLAIAMSGDQGLLSPDKAGNYRLPLGDRSLTYGYELSIQDQMAGLFNADVHLLNGLGDTLHSSQGLRSRERVRTPYLAPGKYRMVTELFANNLMLESRSTSIRIPFHLTERWWFWTGLVSLFSIIVILGLRIQVIRTKAKLAQEELTSQLTRAELSLSEVRREKDSMLISTLTGTINPHFISNVIQWLQSAYLVKRPIEKMEEMAENLSDVIRTIFTKTFAETPSHSLREEVKLVERYFRTVNIQYDEAYEFILPSKEDLQALGDYQVLLMQLQVHVENAIEHGLRFRLYANKVSVQVREDETTIYAIIEDDGAGVERVRLKQAELEQSQGVGTGIMEKLQKTFNQYNQQHLTTVTDSPIFTPREEAPFGTRVTISIPKKYHYALKSSGS